MGRSGKAGGSTSRPRSGAHVRHSPAAPFQQLEQVYWRQLMQKLNVLWNASSCRVRPDRSSSWRAAAIASAIGMPSLAT